MIVFDLIKDLFNELKVEVFFFIMWNVNKKGNKIKVGS